MEEQSLNDKHEEADLEYKPVEPIQTSQHFPNITQTALVLLCLLCLVLIYVPYDNGLGGGTHRTGLVYTAYYAPIIHHSVVILAQLVFKIWANKTMEQMNSIVFGLLLFSSGFIAISDWRSLMASPYHNPPKMFMDMMISSGVLAIFASVLAFANIYVIGKYS